MGILKKLIFATVAFLGGSLLVIWLVLSSSLLSGPRASLAEWIISRETGQPIEIDGGVSIELGAVLQVSVQDLRIPARKPAEGDFAKTASLGFDVALGELIGGDLRLSNVVLDGVEIEVTLDEDGTPSWPEPPSAKHSDRKGAAGERDIGAVVSQILSDHRIELENAVIALHDEGSGFEFDLQLSRFDLSRPSTSAALELNAAGSLNGETLTLTGGFAPDAPLTGQLVFDGIRVDISGAPDQAGYAAGFKISAEADISDLRQLQKILLLNDVLDGKATASADIVFQDDALFVGDANLDVLLDGGQSVVVARTLGPSGGPKDAVLDTTIRLFPEDNEPPATTVRRDLKLVSVYMQLANRIDDVPLRKMVIATNGFVMDTAGVGPPPIAVSGISRSSDGLLRLGDVTLRLGPTDAPFAVLGGSIGDALNVAQIDIGGELALPIASLFAPEVFQGSGVVGEISGDFRLTGNIEKLSLTDLRGHTEKTDLLQLEVNGSIANVLTLNDIDVSLVVGVKSGSDLLAALGLEPIDTGPVDIDAKLTSEGTDWDALARVAVSESELEFNISFDAADPNPIVRGSVSSDLIRMKQIRDIVMAGMQISSLDDAEKEAAAEGDAAPEDDGPFRDVTLLPLGRAILLSGMDMAIGLDLKKIEGKDGTTSLNSDFVLDGGKAVLGPVEFAYGGGQFDLTGTIDLKESPDVLQITGSTGGWDLGKIMRSLNFKKGVSGILNVSLDLSGHHSFVQDFMKTALGWATVSMRNGSIDTQLLDIAGLGVLPWLFSKGKGERAPIVCMHAPMGVAAGKVSSKKIVVETDEVQLVVVGEVNLGNKSLDVHGQPRRIGKPLSRSPWPFSVSGSLADPKIKVKDGPKKLKRSDGATTMPKKRKLCVPDILQLQ